MKKCFVLFMLATGGLSMYGMEQASEDAEYHYILEGDRIANGQTKYRFYFKHTDKAELDMGEFLRIRKIGEEFIVAQVVAEYTEESKKGYKIIPDENLSSWKAIDAFYADEMKE